MSRTPKSPAFRSTALVAVLAAALASTSLLSVAQTAPAASSAPQAAPTGAAVAAKQRQAGPGERHARMAERHQQRLDQLKTRLQLTQQQESAWLAFVARTAPRSHGQPRAERSDRPDFASMTTPQRIERMKAWQAERQARQQQRMEAALSFYQVLTPAQQQVFDQSTVPGFMRAGMKGHGHGHDRGHHEHHHRQDSQPAPKS
ncbi:Spy/CpxP family protein refolding chaperone [uncultured Hydrogenophaga sp.]|uniref:Spy/CpxP family protein refolding chaperone n=1 Tax=uncultured Hydrogenophaga sp. TaxID=199683 RepID=UPI00265F3771|nr:Spy/CpxP family protein refolding chaperone [uncultured Hydrogenophaga sp.]